MIKTISYLGLGTMGSGNGVEPSQSRLRTYRLESGAEEIANRSPRKGARVADTPADAVRDVDLVIYMLSDDQAVEKLSLAPREF